MVVAAADGVPSAPCPYLDLSLALSPGSPQEGGGAACAWVRVLHSQLGLGQIILVLAAVVAAGILVATV